MVALRITLRANVVKIKDVRTGVITDTVVIAASTTEGTKSFSAKGSTDVEAKKALKDVIIDWRQRLSIRANYPKFEDVDW